MSIRINPFNNKNKLLTKNDVQNILKRYGIFQNINNLEIYQEAFIHTSYSLPHIETILSRDNTKLVDKLDGVAPLQKSSYERLEYLGDAIIEGIISAYLFERFPDQDEFFLSRMRVSLVKGESCTHLSKILGLGKHLIISKTMEEQENARIKENILEDIFEAFIGAIYIDFKSFDICNQFLINLLEDEKTKINLVDIILNDGNYKNKLVDYVRKIFKTPITFKVSEIIDDNTVRIYKANVIRNDNNEIIASGEGTDNKKAYHDAAKNGLIKYKVLQESCKTTSLDC
jgi:ribonuclease III